MIKMVVVVSYDKSSTLRHELNLAIQVFADTFSQPERIHSEIKEAVLVNFANLIKFIGSFLQVNKISIYFA